MTTSRFKLYLPLFSVALNITFGKCLKHYSFLPWLYLIQYTGLAADYVIDLLIKWFLYRVTFRKQNTKRLAYLGHATISSYQVINMHSRMYECLLSRQSYSRYVANMLTSLGVPVNNWFFQRGEKSQPAFLIEILGTHSCER